MRAAGQDEGMSVTVKVPEAMSPNSKSVSHAAGEAIEVEEGHLLVKGAFSENRAHRPTIAVYAPGRWFSAEVQGSSS